MRVQVKQERPLSPSTLKLHSLAALQVAQQMQSAQVTAHSLPGESTVTISLDPAEGASAPLGTSSPRHKASEGRGDTVITGPCVIRENPFGQRTQISTGGNKAQHKIKSFTLAVPEIKYFKSLKTFSLTKYRMTLYSLGA